LSKQEVVYGDLFDPAHYALSSEASKKEDETMQTGTSTKTAEVEIPISGGTCPPTTALRNQDVYWHNHDSVTAILTFPFGGWPFSQPQAPITVESGKDSAQFTIQSDTPFATYPYFVLPEGSKEAPGRPLDNPTIKVEPGMGK
jgi:hypothetical protein